MGTLTLGFRLDNALAETFKRATESDIVFAVDGQIRASTLPAADRVRLASLLKTPDVQTVSLENGEYVALSRPLAPAAAAMRAAAPSVLLLRSRSERLRFLKAIRTASACADGRGAGGDDSQLCRRALDHAPAGDDYECDARDVGHGRSDAEDLAEARRQLGGRGREAARHDLQHAHRLDRTVPARGRAARAVVGARTACRW